MSVPVHRLLFLCPHSPPASFLLSLSLPLSFCLLSLLISSCSLEEVFVESEKEKIGKRQRDFLATSIHPLTLIASSSPLFFILSFSSSLLSSSSSLLLSSSSSFLHTLHLGIKCCREVVRKNRQVFHRILSQEKEWVSVWILVVTFSSKQRERKKRSERERERKKVREEEKKMRNRREWLRREEEFFSIYFTFDQTHPTFHQVFFFPFAFQIHSSFYFLSLSSPLFWLIGRERERENLWIILMKISEEKQLFESNFYLIKNRKEKFASFWKNRGVFFPPHHFFLPLFILFSVFLF